MVDGRVRERDWPATPRAVGAVALQLPVPAPDFAVWQRQWLDGEMLQRQLDYWTAQLADLTTLQLPTDHARPAVSSYRGGREWFEVPDGIFAEIKVIAGAGATLFMMLLAAFQSCCTTTPDRLTSSSARPLRTAIARSSKA